MTQPDILKVAVFGAGSIGCYVGGLLSAGGADVTFIGRERFKHAIEANGLTLTHFERPPVIIPPTQFLFSLEPADIAKADIILVTVKSQDSAAAGKTIARFAREDAVVISFQNGVSNPVTLAKHLPRHTVLGGIVPFNVTGNGPGVFHSGTEGDLYVKDHASADIQSLQGHFQAAGVSLQLIDDIVAMQWGKLLINLNNALNTLHGGTLKSGLLQRDYRRAFALMMEEAMSVLATAGIKPQSFSGTTPEKVVKIMRLPNWIYKIIMNFIIKIDASARSSMLDDLEMGRQSEIDYLQGEVISVAKRHGIKAPVNQAIFDSVNAAFAAGQSPKLSGSDILRLVQAI